MNQSTKRILSTIAIVIASVAFGILISADLGLMKQSKAQSSAMQTQSGAVPAAVTIPSFADVAARVMPAVVSIRSTEVVKMSDQQKRFGGIDPFEFFFPDPNDSRRPRRQSPTPDDDDEQQQVSGGSGFIISPDGYILTNNHVIEGASKIDIHYGADENGNGGHNVTAKVVGHDPATDLALLKIDIDQQLPFIRLGDSDRIRKGDWAIAVGHPFQFENTLTVGVISAKGRSGLVLSEETRSFENFIQTDAAINFGNSGGPLMNIAGEVIGINTAIRGGGAQGIGFATPINTAKTLLPQLKQGKITRGYLGMQIQDVTDDVREAFRLPETRGALVQEVDEGKPADKAGIKHGDVVVDVDGKAIRNNRELIDYVSYLPVGSAVKIGLIRNGERLTVTARTAERPSETASNDTTATNPAEPVRNKLGMSVQNLTPELRRMYNIATTVNGVVVVNVKNVSPAGDANLTEGDVISEVQGQPVNSVDEFRNVLDKVKTGQRVRFYVTSQTRNGAISTYRILQAP
jgi:serine protease Do